MRLSVQDNDTGFAISLTPLIDVVFILLIFFMLASSFLDWAQIPVQGQEKASRSFSSSSATQTEVLRLSLFADGDILLQGKRVPFRQLQDYLARQSEKPRVLIAVEDGIAVQQTLDFLARLRVAGVVDMVLRE